MKYLIVNVDDLGGSRGVNRGILETLLSRGAVTGCSPGRRPGEVYAFDCCRSCGLKRIPLGKGGVDAPSRNIPVPLKGADGVVRSNSKTISFERTTPSAPVKVASQHFLDGRSHPSFAYSARRGVRFVIEGIESVRSVFKAITATRNAAKPIQFSQRKTLAETAMGEMGLKSTIIGRNPVARRYWPAR